LNDREGIVVVSLFSVGLSDLTFSFWFLLADNPRRVPPQLLLKLTVE
jgi:hypothetical protein